MLSQNDLELIKNMIKNTASKENRVWAEGNWFNTGDALNKVSGVNNYYTNVSEKGDSDGFAIGGDSSNMIAS